MKNRNKKTNVFVILNEANLEVVKNKAGHPLKFETWADANKHAAEKMLEVWDVKEVKFEHPFIQHDVNFVKFVDVPLKMPQLMTAELKEFLENADLCFQDTPGTVRFAEQVLFDTSQKAALESIGQLELTTEIHRLRSQGALTTVLDDNWLHLTFNADVLMAVKREPSEL